MSALATFDRELSQHDDDGNDSWYDSGVVFVGQLAADLSEDELTALSALWPAKTLPWQRHCAEVLPRSRHLQAIVVLLDMMDRAQPDVALTALESLREFDPKLFDDQQRQRILGSIEVTQTRPVGRLHQIVLGAFLARLREDDLGKP